MGRCAERTMRQFMPSCIVGSSICLVSPSRSLNFACVISQVSRKTPPPGASRCGVWVSGVRWLVVIESSTRCSMPCQLSVNSCVWLPGQRPIGNFCRVSLFQHSARSPARSCIRYRDIASHMRHLVFVGPGTSSQARQPIRSRSTHDG